MAAPYLTLELTSEQAMELRSLLGRAGDLPACLKPLDHLVGKAIGVPKRELYVDILFHVRWALIREDRTVDLNAAESVLAGYGEHDLNLTEEILGEWARTHTRPENPL